MKNKFIIILFLLGLIVFKTTAQNVIANSSASKIQSSTTHLRRRTPSCVFIVITASISLALKKLVTFFDNERLITNRHRTESCAWDEFDEILDLFRQKA
jgi:hypothetical protein